MLCPAIPERKKVLPFQLETAFSVLWHVQSQSSHLTQMDWGACYPFSMPALDYIGEKPTRCHSAAPSLSPLQMVDELGHDKESK